MLGLGGGGLDEREHLDLVELVDAEDPPRVLAGGTGLAPEAGRDAGVAARQLAGVEDVAGVEGGERHLGGADQEEVIPLVRLVDHLALAREHPGPVERGLAHQHRWDDRLEALPPNGVDREAHERELHQHQVAEEVGEPSARDLRGLLHLDPAVALAQLEVVARPGSRTPAVRRPRAASPHRPRRRRGRRGAAGSAAWRPARRGPPRPRQARPPGPWPAPRPRASRRSAARRLPLSASPRRSHPTRRSASRAGPRPAAAARGDARRGGAARRGLRRHPAGPARHGRAAGSSRMLRRSSEATPSLPATRCRRPARTRRRPRRPAWTATVGDPRRHRRTGRRTRRPARPPRRRRCSAA